MDGIVELDHDAMYVVVEPGVTFGQLKSHLDEHAPELVYTYPFAPPFTSVMANALLDGLNNLSMRHGAMGKWINGLEAVLPDGEVVRTGSGGVVRSWFSRSPLPDLSGLFVSVQGTTGIVTRAALQLQPKPAHRRRWFAFAFDLEAAYAKARSWTAASFDPRAVARAELAWWVARRVPGQNSPEQVGRLIAQEYALLYETSPENVGAAALLRAKAASMRDAQADRPDWPAIAQLLRASYDELLAALASANV